MVLVSDLLTPVDTLPEHLSYLRSQGHEVVLFQVLDPRELTFDFDGPAQFEDLESGKKLFVDPQTWGDRYREKMETHLAEIQTICDRLGVTRRLLPTDEPLETALSEFLRSRQTA